MIPFNKPYRSGKELANISEILDINMLSGDQVIVRMCEKVLEKKYGFNKTFLTNSCTIALEMSAILANIQPGDEVIIPSYTYVSTANAFALRGAKIIFADSNSFNPNIDADSLEVLVTPKTKAIVVMHYGGIACDMDKINSITTKYNLLLIEDAAQCIDSYYKNIALGSIGDLGCFSFHETKNIHCGEGGLLAINNKNLIDRAEIIRNKGTNRAAFIRSEVDNYEWMDLGVSTFPATVTAAFLHAQLEKIDEVQKKRISLWNKYTDQLQRLQEDGYIELPVIPKFATNNAHVFFIVCKTGKTRSDLMKHLKEKKIEAVPHYRTLHNSRYYMQYHGKRELYNADKYNSCLLRLPMYFDLSFSEIEFITKEITHFLTNNYVRN